MARKTTRQAIRNADFRMEVLERLRDVHPRRVDFAPVIHARAGVEGKSLRYYGGILEALVEKKLIVLDLGAIAEFERSNGAFDDYPVRAMITTDGIDEYYRLRKLGADAAISTHQRRRLTRAEIIIWISVISAFLASFVALAKIFHWWGI